jgi:hypothetical protein
VNNPAGVVVSLCPRSSCCTHDSVAALPQASDYVPGSGLCTNIVNNNTSVCKCWRYVPQLSVAVALPRAASMASAVGLQPKIPFVGVPIAVITGFLYIRNS